MSRCLAIVASLALLAHAAPADAGDTWADASENDDAAALRLEYERAMQTGDDLALIAIDGTAGASNRDELVKRAVLAYDAAGRARPDAVEPRLRAAHLIFALYLNGPGSLGRMARKVIAYWDEAERLAPLDPRVTDILFPRAILHTKLGGEAQIRAALDDYHKLLDRGDPASENPDEVATWLGNLAETYMMLGQLDDAVEQYRAAVAWSARTSLMYGLAVALDRNGSGAQARELIAALGPTQLDWFKKELDDGVIFFVPDGEEFYYLALAEEALGRSDDASLHWELFVTSGAYPKFAPRARENRAALQARRRSKER